MREILKGIVDVHVHAGPSVAKREVDAAEMLRDAVGAGYRAFVVKDHYFPTMMSAQIVEKHLGEGKIKVFGGLALNNSVGGINVKAVDSAYGMGAKFIYMPTVSAANHIEKHKGHAFVGSGASSVEERPIVYADKDGKLLKEVHEVLAYVAQKPDLILATGHGSAREIDALVPAAVAAGVKKIFINHPHFLIGADIPTIARWAKAGCYIELNACVFPPQASGKPDEVPLAIAQRILENVPLEQLVVDSDFGQKGNGSPVDGLYRFIKALMVDIGVTEAQIDMMAKKTPAKLLGI